METGLKHTEKITVTQKDTAKIYGSGTLEVFATPAMAALMEKTAMNSVAPFLEAGQATVGTKLEIEHLSASPVGIEVWCESELVETDRKRLVFEVSAYDEAGLIGKGRHERFIIDIQRFMEKTQAKMK